MPLDGEKLDELLSGFVDGVLSESERKLVEEAARGDARIEQRIHLLRRQASEVGEFGKVLVEQTLRQRNERNELRRQSLVETVIDQARQLAWKEGLGETHFVHGRVVQEDPAVTISSPPATLRRRSVGRQRLVVAGSLATAAAVLLAVVLNWPADKNDSADVASSNAKSPWSTAGTSPADVSPSTPDFPSRPVGDLPVGDLPVGDLPVAEGPTRVVGQFNQVAFALVADVQITLTGLRENVLEDILAVAGIPRVEPVVADEKIMKAMDQSRMIVNPQGNPTQQMYILVIRAEMREIDKALQNIWKDNIHFPNVSLNLAVDARAGLVREILNGTGAHFSLEDSFAVPLTAESSAPRLAASSPFPGVDKGVSYVSSNKRSSGWASPETLMDASSISISTILLVIHLVE